MALNKESKGEEYDQSYFKLISPIQILKHSIYVLSLTLLTLLLPLSFLLLSKLASSPSLLIPPPPYFVIRLLVSSLTLSSLLFSLTGHLPKPRPAIAWVIVCSFQACITLGIEATIAQGIKPTHSPVKTTQIILIERAIFFLGIYEIMMHWKSVFVKVVVEDAVYSVEVEESRAGRLVVGAAFGGLWWWMLRDEVEPMVMDAMGGGKGFVVWVVSYSTVVIGMVRVVEIVFWAGRCVFMFLWHREAAAAVHVTSHVSSNDEVVLLL